MADLSQNFVKLFSSNFQKSFHKNPSKIIVTTTKNPKNKINTTKNFKPSWIFQFNWAFSFIIYVNQLELRSFCLLFFSCLFNHLLCNRKLNFNWLTNSNYGFNLNSQHYVNVACVALLCCVWVWVCWVFWGFCEKIEQFDLIFVNITSNFEKLTSKFEKLTSKFKKVNLKIWKANLKIRKINQNLSQNSAN